MKRLNNQKGITLIELMISLVLLGIVLAIAYNFFFYTKKTYSDAEKKWIVQSNVRQIADFMNTELKTAYYAEISYNDNQQEGDVDLYVDDGKIMYKRYDDPEPSQISDGMYSITFEKAKKSGWSETSPEKNRINNTITYTINALDTDGETVLFTLESSVYLENMLEDRAINGNYTGNKLRYQHTSKDSPMPSDIGSSRCFIATAAYGSPKDSSVVLLRQFRDRVLLTNAPGRAFVDFYYHVSPPIAKAISGKDALKVTVRLLLTPIVGIASIFVYREMMYLCIFLLFVFMYFRKRNRQMKVLR